MLATQPVGVETGVGERGSTGGLGVQHEGDLCSINGHPGHLRVDGKLQCIADASDVKRRTLQGYHKPDDNDGDDKDDYNNNKHLEKRTSDVNQLLRDHQNKMAGIYDELDHELTEAWRRS